MKLSESLRSAIWNRPDPPDSLAEQMAFSVSTIRLNRTRLGLPCNVHPLKPLNAVHEMDRPAPKDKPNPLKVAKIWLGGRLVEKPVGYFLDDLPVNLDTILRETNRLIKAQGAEQIGHSNRWLV
jgi:hypothetical protein